MNRIVLLGEDLPFSKILSCTLNDNSYVEKGSIKLKSTSADVTKVIQDNDRVIHDYTVIVNIDSLFNPVVRIYVGNNGTKTNDIIGLLKVVIGIGKKMVN